MISYEIGIIILLTCVVVSRIISVKAARSMSKEKKAETIDKFSGFAAYGMIPYVVIIAAYFLLAPVAVKTASQGHGIGQSLIKFGIKRLKENGAKFLVTYGDPAF